MNLVIGIITVVTSMLGAGTYMMPAAFANSGLILGSCILLAVSIVTSFSIYSLFAVSKLFEHKEELSYAWIGQNIHKSIKTLIDIALFFSAFFTALLYQKYIVTLLNNMIRIPEEYELLNTFKNPFYLTIISFPLFFLCLKKNLDSLKIFSGISLCSVILLPIILCVYNIVFKDYISLLPSEDFQTNYSFSLSNFILAMCCQMNVTEIFVELKKKSKTNLILISLLGSFIALIIYGSVGILGYRLIGNDIGKNNLISIFASSDSKFMNYLYKNHIVFFVINKCLVCLAMISLFGCFPIQLFAATQTLLSFDIFKTMNLRKSYIIILVPTFLIMVLVNSIPAIDLNIFFSILGAVISNYLAYLIPFGYYAALKWKGIGIKPILSIVIMLLSIGYSIYGIIDIIISLLSQVNSDTTKDLSSIYNTTTQKYLN